MKCVDGTSNPYLAFAGLIAAGVEGGVKTNRALEVGDCSAHGEGKTAAEMGEEERVRRGITQRLPLSWEEARAAFRGDGVLREAFGEAFVTGYLNVNKVRFFVLILCWSRLTDCGVFCLIEVEGEDE